MKRTLFFGVAVALSFVSGDVSAQTVNGACWVRGERADLELRASPFDSSTIRLNAGEVKVCYSRPRKLGRPVMGRLVPYGQPWRLGADEATSILLPVRARVAGLLLEPGWYSLYAIPDQREWRIIVNADVRRWGTPIDNAVRERDIGFGVVPVESASEAEDMFSMRLQRKSENAAELLVRWDRTVLRVPVVLTPS
jgi:hypothetical protein